MNRALLLALSVVLFAACGGPPKAAVPDAVVARELSALTVTAFRAEALEAPEKAFRAYADLIFAAKAGESAWHLAAARAAVDALVLRQVASLERVTDRSALAFRMAKTREADPERDAERLFTSSLEGASPVVRRELLRGLVAVATRRGDAAAASRARAASGCATAATVLGPVDWKTLTALDAPSPLDAYDAPMPAEFTTPGAFGRRVAPARIEERGCHLPLAAVTAEAGLREVVVDVTVPKAQSLVVELQSTSAARLRIGGLVALERAHELGGRDVALVARASVDEGRVRLVARVADAATLALSVLSEDGEPLTLAAPKAGERATARATRVQALRIGDERSNVYQKLTMPERLLTALGALAADDARSAERVVAASFLQSGDPELGLVYVRALNHTPDIPYVQRQERARGAVTRILDKWPTAWEASLLSAKFAAERRGEGESQIEAIRVLDTQRKKGASSPLLDASEAVWSVAAGLHDRTEAALARFHTSRPGAVLGAELRRAAVRATTSEQLPLTCGGDTDRMSFACYWAQAAVSGQARAKEELQRLRALAGAPRGFIALAMRTAIGAGDLATARAEYQATLPGERNAAAVLAMEPGPGIRDRLVATLITSREPPSLLGAALTSLGDERFKAFEGVAERVLAEDKAKRAMPEAATVVLSHTERYTVEPSGLLHVLLHDVRRVGGTTDVESNAQAAPPTIHGRGGMRAVVRRVFKSDGRILLPDPTPGAAQSHADLSQLSPGDAVEALYEGFALPSDAFDLGFDTPDLLPERTAVVKATVELRLPRDFKPSMRAHRMLGAATTKDDGLYRLTTYTVQNQAARRLESDVPRMDNDVGVTLTTSTWDKVGRSLAEALRDLDEQDPEVGAWARQAGGGGSPHGAVATMPLLARVVTAAGEALKEPRGAILSDTALVLGHGPSEQTRTARTFLAEREGNRTWLIGRALRELGIATETVIAEEQPYSSDPDFPAGFGRFIHPLLVAKVMSAEGKPEEVVIDADVPGPPLPPGRFSPELRGRKVLHADGRITALAEGDATERDEIDLRLVLDKKGDARGSFTAVLRGRAAQELADAFTRIVGDERTRALRNVVLAFVPAANVEVVALSSSEGSWQIALRADITIGGYAQEEKSKKGDVTWVIPGVDPIHFVYPRPFVTTVTSEYASQGARQNALAVARAVQYHLRRRVDLPDGAKVVRAPGPLRKEAPLLFGERAVSGSAKFLEDNFVLSVRTGTVGKDAYGTFVETARRIDEGFLASTRLKL